jgi:thiol-disulfide isomerase/thioredoxin
MRIAAKIFLILAFTLYLLPLQAQSSVENSTLNLYDLDITFFRPADSSQISSKSVIKRGKEPVVLVFWLTTCQPCLREMDTYGKAFASWKKEAKFNMLAVSIDYPNRFKRINAILKEKSLPFDAYWDAHRGFKEVLPGGLNGLPQVFLFNPGGQLVWQHKGFMPGDEQELFRQIKNHQQK